MRKYTTSKVAQALGIAEATVRQRRDLPVAEVLDDGQRLFDGDKIDLLSLTKAMGCGGSLLGLSRAAVVAKFAEAIEGDPSHLDALLSVVPIILRDASEADRLQVGAAVATAIRAGSR